MKLIDLVRNDGALVSIDTELMFIDGCRSETTNIPSHSGNPNLTIIIMWPETNIGEHAVVDCPCGNMTSQKGNLIGTRYCGGDFTLGSQWRNPNVTSCNFSDLAREICQLTEVYMHSLKCYEIIYIFLYSLKQKKDYNS